MFKRRRVRHVQEDKSEVSQRVQKSTGHEIQAEPQPNTDFVSGLTANQQAVVGMQRTFGNAYVLRMLSIPTGVRSIPLQRLTAAEKAEDLKSSRFAGVDKLENAFDNSPPLRSGDSGDPVKLIQQALIEDGFSLPESTKKLGEPDGIFGNETLQAVKGFQKKYGLLEKGRADGVIGRHTMGKFDQLFVDAPPAKKDPEIEANDKAMGAHVVQGMDNANLNPQTADSGIQYPYNYEANFPDQWKDDYRSGFANPAYWERLDYMNWRLKPGMSASAGIKEWLKGLTIAECKTTLLAIEFDTLRAAVGDEKFDAKFGKAHEVLPDAERLQISPQASQINDFFKAPEATESKNEGKVGNRPGVKEGEWYYFYNHPKYLLKHPGGAWQGENAVYMGRNKAGEQTWAGLGTQNERSGSTHITEKEMFEEMIADYKRPRDADDQRALDGIKAQNGGVLPPEYVEQKDGGTEFPDEVTESMILNDPPYKIGDTTRKGGFLLEVGKKLDESKVKALRGS